MFINYFRPLSLLFFTSTLLLIIQLLDYCEEYRISIKSFHLILDSLCKSYLLREIREGNILLESK